MILRFNLVQNYSSKFGNSSLLSIDSRGGTSDVVGEMEVEPLPEPPVPAVAVLVDRFLDSFQWLAEVDVEVVFKQRPSLMKSVPGFLKGAYRSAMRVALAEIDQGRSEEDATRSSRGWKLFLLLPRLLLHKPSRGWFGAKEAVAALIRGVLRGRLGLSPDCQHGACHPCSQGQFSSISPSRP